MINFIDIGFCYKGVVKLPLFYFLYPERTINYINYSKGTVMNKFDELLKELETKTLTELSADDQELVKELFTRKSQESDTTERPAVKVGYIYNGQLIDLDRPDLGSVESMALDCERVASIFTVALSNIMYAIRNVGSTEDATKYKEYIIKNLGEAVDKRTEELVKKLEELITKNAQDNKATEA